MARIGVLAAHQPLTAKPCETVPKAVAKLLIRRNLALQVSKHLIQLIALRAACVQLRHSRADLAPSPRYIPETLPAAELPGIIFKAPLRPEWVNSYHAPQS